MGMFLFIFISRKQLWYKIRTSLLCRGSADFFTAFKRDRDFITNIIIAMMPTSHIPHNMSPIMDGVSLLTDSTKSFICFVVPDIFGFMVFFVTASIFDAATFFHAPSQSKTCGNPNGRKGTNGTARIKRSRSHKWNCIRLVR